MEELEILAYLKRSYFYIDDIIDNASPKQIKDKTGLMQTLDIIADEYERVYKLIKELKGKELVYKGYIISDIISMDYIDDENEYRTYLDLDLSVEWWEDTSFIYTF